MSTLSATIGRGTTGSRPAASEAGRLYYDTTAQIWYRDNGSSWDSCTPSALTNPMTTEGDIIYGGASGTPTRRPVGTAAYGLVSDGTDPVWAEVLPWHILILPQITTPDATTGTWAASGGYTDSGIGYPFYVPGSTANSGGAGSFGNEGSGALDDACAYDIVLAKGTWDFNAWVRKASNNGIITLQQDGSDMGTVDTYAAAVAAAKVSVTGWTVSSTGKKRMNLKMHTKNASASAYRCILFGIEFRRTA